MKARTWNRCSPGCRGFVISDSTHVERCDECSRFESDIEAAHYMYQLALWIDIMEPATPALQNQSAWWRCLMDARTAAQHNAEEVHVSCFGVGYDELGNLDDTEREVEA